MQYTLKELLDVPRLRELLDSLDELHSLPSAIIDLEGNILTATAWQDICTKFHRVNPEVEKMCLESDLHIESRLETQAPHVIYRCPMGLIDAAIPIIIEGKHLGNVFSGQLFTEPPDEADFLNQARQYGFDETEYLAAMRKVPLFTEDRLRKNLNFIHSLTQMLAEQGLQTKRQAAADEKLLNSREKYQRIFENLQDVYYEATLDGTILEISPSINTLSRYQREELIGTSLTDIYADIQEREKYLELVSAQGKVHNFEIQLKDKDGSQHSCSITATLIKDSQGTPEKLIGCLRDISESKRTEEALRVQIAEYEASQQQLKESEERFKTLHNAAFGGVFVHDQGIILECNQVLSEITGFSNEELVGMDAFTLVAPGWHELVKRNIERGKAQRFDAEGVRKDGSIYPLAINGKHIRYLGRRLRVVEFLDISARKNAEKALLESERRLKDSLTNMPIAVALSDEEQAITFRNKRFVQLFGYTEEDVPTLDAWWQQAYPDKQIRQLAIETWGDALHKAIAEGTPIEVHESPVTCKDGVTRIIEISGILLGKETLTTFTDVTEQRQAEEAIENRLIALTQPMDSAEISFEELFNVADVQRLQDEFAQATGVASIITNPGGEPLTAPSNFTYLCDQIIRKTENGCANCFKSDAALGRYNPDGPIIQPCLSGGLWDAGAAITVGGHHIANWLIGQVRDDSQTEDKMRAYAREIGVDETYFMGAFHDVPAMSLKQFEQVAQALFTLSNQLSTAAYQNVQQARFITERRRAEDELSAERFRLSEIIRGTNVGTWEWNVQTGKTVLNERWAEIIGYSLGDFANSSIEAMLECFHPNDLLKRSELLERHFSGELDCYDFEFRMKHKSGRWVWVVARGKVSSWTDDGKPLLMYGTLTDVDERKRREEQQQTLEKLNSIGTLAGGIAHDFNNIMAGVYGNISLAKLKLTPDQPGFKFLEAAEKSMGRATLLTNQLLTFAKGGEPVTESLSLGNLVEEVVHFNLSGSNVKPVITQAENLWLVKADLGQIQQVFANLTINAKQAMPDGGHLDITMENADVPQGKVSGLAAGKYIRIRVTDEGTGIDPEYLERIFDPYFTTKQTGSGLGLATTYSIINKHGGHISVESQLGQGTSFALYLPASELKDLPEKEAQIDPSAASQTAKVLLMDDEEMIRSTVTSMLEELNYKVETASGGQQAIVLYQAALEAGRPFDLVILDLTIPGGMGGKAVAKNILKLDPAARLIVSSGYADDPVMANYPAYGFRGVVAKPYNLNKLSSALTAILGK